jgi:drug/metabolite transporter (DMT)-like permease
MKKNPVLLIISIILLYTTWSSTYLAIRVAVRTIPPLIMTSSRFIIAGMLMYLLALMRGEKQPAPKEWLAAALIGTILFLMSNVLLCVAEQTVDSGVSAIAVSSGALWMCLFSGFFGKWPSRIEWLGIITGFAGILILNLGGTAKGNLSGGLVLILSAMIWSFGSVLSKKIRVPSGFMGSGIEMFFGGLASLITAVLLRQNFNIHPSAESITALIYLIIVGGMVGFSSFMYVLQNARPALASSYAYVNTIGAVFLGAILLKEKISASEIGALIVVVAGVVIVATAHTWPGQKAKFSDENLEG